MILRKKDPRLVERKSSLVILVKAYINQLLYINDSEQGVLRYFSMSAELTPEKFLDLVDCERNGLQPSV